MKAIQQQQGPQEKDYLKTAKDETPSTAMKKVTKMDIYINLNLVPRIWIKWLTILICFDCELNINVKGTCIIPSNIGWT